MTDTKTLRLATLELTPSRLERFLVYQRALLNGLSSAGHPHWDGRYAFAHGHAIHESQLDLIELGKLKSMIAEFCGKRWAIDEIKARLAQNGVGETVVTRAQKELPRLENWGPFVERHGQSALTLLEAHAVELMQLHRSIATEEGAGGHVHLQDANARSN